MKFKIGFLVYFLMLIASNVSAQDSSVKDLSPEDFKRILSLNPKVVLIDVRTKKEFKRGHIEGALLADNSKKLYALIDSFGKSKVYLLYCDCGERSIDAGKMLCDKYQISVCSLDGGLEKWFDSGFGL